MTNRRAAAAGGIGHEWTAIKDLPEDWPDLCREDLRAVHLQWTSDRNLVRDQSKINEIQERLAVRWAIETGIIERLYNIDQGVTIQIAEAGMTAIGQFHNRGELSTEARTLITDHRESLEMVMDIVGGTRKITDSFIRQLHQRLTLSQEYCEAENQFGELVRLDLIRGEWKKSRNNPRRPDGSIHEYCPPEFVQDQMDQLLRWHVEHESKCVCPEVEAAWLHHRFTQIHPFQDGNGRVARALTGAVFLKKEFLVLVVRDEEHRERYLNALENADAGDLRPLVDLFADIQIHDLNEAIKALRELRGETVVSVVESLAKRAGRRRVDAHERAAGVMEALLEIARIRLDETQAELKRAFDEQKMEVDFRLLEDEETRTDWWSWQIIETARKHGYFADLVRQRRWISLSLSLPMFGSEDARLVFSLHAVGRAANLYAATAFLTSRLGGGDSSDSRRWQIEIVSERPFKYSTATSITEKTRARFRKWLEENIERGLDLWGARL